MSLSYIPICCLITGKRSYLKLNKKEKSNKILTSFEKKYYNLKSGTKIIITL